MTLKIRGRSKKTEGWTGPKSRGGSLAVGTYLQRGSAPPPPERDRERWMGLDLSGGGRGGEGGPGYRDMGWSLLMTTDHCNLN